MPQKKSFSDLFGFFISSFSLKCPQCEEVGLFPKIISIKTHDKCPSCGLHLNEFDIGDGPAYISGFIISFLLPIFSIIYEVMYKPDALHHVIFGLSAAVILTFLCLKYSRSAFYWIEYHLKYDN